MKTRKKLSLIIGLLLIINIAPLEYKKVDAYFDSNFIKSGCSLGIYPFNPGKQEVDYKSKQWFKLFEDLGNAVCNQHLKYPNQYDPQPPVGDNNINTVAGAENIHAPTAQHNHTVWNASAQDDYYYKSYLDSFQIILKQDAINNTYVDKQHIICQTPDQNNNPFDTPTCDTNGQALNMWGGTTIDYDEGTRTITWKFGATDPTNRPKLWGENPGMGVSRSHMGFGVRMISKDVANAQLWSGSTISRALVRDMEYRVGTGDAFQTNKCQNDGVPGAIINANGQWCSLPAPNIPGVINPTTITPAQNVVAGTNNVLVDGKQYYWIQVADVATVWKKPSTAPSTCSALNWTIKQGGKVVAENAVQANTPTTFTVTPAFTGTSKPLKYVWKAGTGGMMGTPFSPVGTFDGNQQGSNGYETTKTSVSYSGGSGVMVYVQAYYEDGTTATPCFKGLFIPKASVFCANLNMTLKQNGNYVAIDKVLPNVPVQINVTPSYNPANKSVPLKYKWSAKQGVIAKGTFAPGHPADGSYITALPYATYNGGEDVTVGVQALYYDGASGGSQCYKEFYIPKVPEVTCTGLTLTTDPASLLTKDKYGDWVLPKKTPATLKVTPTFSDPSKPFPLDYTYSASPLMKTGPLPVDWEPGMNTIDLSKIEKVELEQVPYYKYGFNGVLLAAKQSTAPSSSAYSAYGAGSQTAVAAGTASAINTDFSKAFIPGFHAGIVDYFSLGRFKDSISDSDNNLANPYTDPATCQWLFGCSDDREAYYTGGEPSTLIRVIANRHGNPNDTFGEVCSASIIILPEENTCVDLKVTADPALKENTPTTFTVTPTFKDPSKPIPLNYYWTAGEQKVDSPIGRIDFDLFARPDWADILEKVETGGESESSAGNDFSKVGIDLGIGLSDAALDLGGTQPIDMDKFKEPLYMEPIEIVPPKPDPIDELNKAAMQFGQTAILDPKTSVSDRAESTTGSNYSLSTGLLKTAGSQPAAQTVVPRASLQDIADKLGKIISYGKFSNDSNKLDLANPYLEKVDNKTYYTGGAGGTWISVIAQDKNGNPFPTCKGNLQIPESPTICAKVTPRIINAAGGPVELKDLQANNTYSVGVDPKGTVYENGSPIANYRIIITNPLTPGTLTSPTPATCPTPKIDTNSVNVFSAPVTCTYQYSSKAGDNISIWAVPDNRVSACKVSFTIPGAPVCDDAKFTLTSSNGTDLQPYQTTLLTATAKNTDGSDINYFDWSASTGILYPEGICANYILPAANLYHLPKECAVTYGGGTAGSTVSVSSYPQESGTICKRQIKVIGESQSPWCTNITVNPNSLGDVGTSRSYNAFATFSDGQTYPAALFDWSSDHGDSTTIPQTSYYNYTRTAQQNAQISVDFNSVPGTGITDKFGLCSQTISATDLPGRCELLRSDDFSESNFCVTSVPPQYADYLQWTIDRGIDYSLYNNDQCIRIYDYDDNKRIRVSVPGQSNCSLEKPLRETTTRPPERPEFEKFVKQIVPEKTGNKTVLTAIYDPNKADDTKVQYTLEFTSHADYTTTIITDPAFKKDGYSNYYIEGQLIPGGSKYTPGRLYYKQGSTVINGIGVYCPQPDPEDEDPPEKMNCWENAKDGSDTRNITDGIKLIKVPNGTKVTITYQGNIQNSPIMKPEICMEGIVCEEIYINDALADYRVVNADDNSLGISGELKDRTRIQIFCQYILSRAAGDIFLESDLNSGVDINQCSRFKSGTGIIVTPAPTPTQQLGKTGAPAEIFTIEHEICAKGQTGTFSDTETAAGLTELYGKAVTELSSQICEIKLQTGSSWKQSVITNSIEENKTRIARWEKSTELLSELIKNPDQKVIRYTGQDVTVDSELIIPEGAKTVIIEDGDLIINKNIKYKTEGVEATSVKDIPSVAFIVLNGNIIVDKSVEELAGIYYVQQDDEGTGQLRAKGDEFSTKPLIIYGSVYGDIDPLFSKRPYAGDPSADMAGITIRFDQRVILNTPPGLRDIMNVSEEQVAR